MLALFPGLPHHYCRKSKTSFAYVSTVQCTLEIGSACFASRKGETGGGGAVGLGCRKALVSIGGPFLSFAQTSLQDAPLTL